MTDEESFQAALDADPADHGMRLVFADWLKERGNPRADGYLWLGLNRKFPMVDGQFANLFNLVRWHWWHKNAEEPRNCRLPISKIIDMENFGLWRSFASRRAAENAFARAYPKLVAAHPQEFRLNLEAV